jgi:hypothetical protein
VLVIRIRPGMQLAHAAGPTISLIPAVVAIYNVPLLRYHATIGEL